MVVDRIKTTWALLLVLCLLLSGSTTSLASAQEEKRAQESTGAETSTEDEFTNRSFWSAARNGDLEHVQGALKAGIDVNAKTEYGATAIFFACDRGHKDVVEFLLKNGADPNVKDTFYNATPVTWAQMKEHTDIVLMLLKNGGKNADSILFGAVSGGNVDFVKQIIATDAVAEKGLIAARDAALKVTDEDKRKALLEIFKSLNLPEPKTFELSEGLIKKYAGGYANDQIAVEVVAADKGISIKFNGGEENPLAAESETEFKLGPNKISFDLNGDKVTALVLKFGEREFKLAPDNKSEEAVEETKPEKMKEAVAEEKPKLGASSKQSLAADRKVSSRNWPGFRGVGSRGVAEGQQPPTSWSLAEDASENLLWKTDVPGLGLSCPTIWGNRIYLTTAVAEGDEGGLKIGLYGDVDSIEEEKEYEFKVLCYQKTTGKLLWEHTANKAIPKVKRHAKSSHANSTVATNGDYAVAFFGSEGLFCYTKKGELVWEKDLGFLDSGWFYDPGYQWGFASSPVIHDGKVIVQCDVQGQSFLEVFNLEGGESVWRTERDEIPGWSTPLVHEFDSKTLLITNGTKAARAYDIEDGSLVWSLKEHSEIVVPTPNVAHNLIFISSGYSPIQPIYAIKPNAEGDISLEASSTTSDSIPWSVKRGGPYMPSPVIYGDYLYCCSNSGILSCYKATTGDVVYKQRLKAKGGGLSFTASPLAGDGHLYLTAEDGRVLVVKAGPEFELEKVNELGESILSTPAVSMGAMFFRTEKSLIAVGELVEPKRKKNKADEK